MVSNEILKRYQTCFAGIAISSAGIALITRAGLGTSQISSLPYVTSFILPVSLGAATFVMNALFVLVQLCLLRREFGKNELMQLPLTFVFSLFIDLMMCLCGPVAPSSYPAQLSLCLAGSAVLAFGISLQVVSNVAILPGEGIVRTIARKRSLNFGRVKTAFDLSLVAAAILVSFVCLRKLVGIREGTVLAALLVGSLTRLILPRLAPLNRWFAPAPRG
jgi:uncharacterized membrane protein YczE